MSAPPASSDASQGGDAAQLRVENAELRQRNRELEARAERRSGWRGIARSTAVVILVVVGSVLLTVSVPVIWGRNLVLNTDRYVSTLAPLARNAGLQDAIVKAVDKQFQDHVDIEGVVRAALPPRIQGIAGAIQGAADTLVDRTARAFVESDAFANLWVAVNRVAHKQLVAILTGRGTDNTVVHVQNGTVVLDLTPIVARVKQDLVNAGLTVAAAVPVVGSTIEIAQVHGLEKAQQAVRQLNRLAYALPIVGLVCLLAGVLLARRRRRCATACALAVAGGTVLLGIAIALARSAYIGALPLVYLSNDSAGALFDTLVRYLRLGVRVLLVIALVVAVIVWLTGPASAARTTRRVLGSAPKTVVRSALTQRGIRAIAAHRGVAITATSVIAALVLVLWTNPSWLAILLVIGIAVLIICAFATMRPETATPELTVTPPA